MKKLKAAAKENIANTQTRISNRATPIKNIKVSAFY
jgi:hypothetical protein